MRNAAVRATIDAIQQGWIANRKEGKGLLPRPCKPALLPDLVDAARVAAVAANEVYTADTEPAGDPYVDGVDLGQPARYGTAEGRALFRHGTQHGKLIGDCGAALDAPRERRLIARNISNLMAARGPTEALP